MLNPIFFQDCIKEPSKTQTRHKIEVQQKEGMIVLTIFLK